MIQKEGVPLQIIDQGGILEGYHIGPPIPGIVSWSPEEIKRQVKLPFSGSDNLPSTVLPEIINRSGEIFELDGK